VAVTESARRHLFETISRQYGVEDARALIEMLTSVENLATKQDIAELRAEFKDAMYQHTRTVISWMFGLLTAYTAMAGSLVAVAMIVD
jgi:hypothetical protein